MKSSISALRRVSTAALVLCSLAAAALAQTDKSVVPEAVPAFPAFNQWTGAVLVTIPESPVVRVSPVQLALQGPVGEATYQPQPVIMGQPDFMLVGAGSRASAKGWNSGWNLQGLHARLVVLDARGVKREMRSMSGPLRTGDRFKIRVTATFDAVAQVDQVVGDPWYGKRTGQVYPKPGQSVSMKAGETVDLPLGADEYFLMHRAASERLVLSVRHPQANGDSRSAQPAYRQDSKGGSSYVQLVPQGTYAAIEQLVAPAR